jgi:hypothetical protein
MSQLVLDTPAIFLKVSVPGSQPNPIDFGFTSTGVDSNGIGEASTGKVQFNINSDRGITGPKVLGNLERLFRRS